MDAQPLISWLAPILSTLIVCAGQLALNGRFKRADEKRDQARADTEAERRSRAEWRDSIERRLNDQDDKIKAVLRGQTTQMRSDLVHKAHRYIDDLGCASMEEKDAFNAEYVDYCAICDAHGIENSFVDQLAQQVMALPNRGGASHASSGLGDVHPDRSPTN